MKTTPPSRALQSAPTITSSTRPRIRRLASTSLLITIIAITCGTRAPATVVGTGLVEQPIYLGSASQPDRIPLAPAICNSNKGYGTHATICQSRPCYQGHFVADGATVYEQNLAALFGVSLELSDPTQLPTSTATFRLRPVEPPANAPYSQEQVMAAALQCLLFRAGSVSKEHPLTVVVTGDGMPTPEWASKYAGKYGHEDREDGEAPPPIAVPGVSLENTALGVRYLVFDGVPAKAAIKRRDPVFIPFRHEGDREGEMEDIQGAYLIPVWHGDAWAEPLNLLTTPYLPYYEKWSSGATGRNPEQAATPYLAPPHPVLRRSDFDVGRSPDKVSVSFRLGDSTPGEFAAIVYACILTVQPTQECPLVIELADLPEPKSYRALMLKDPAWEEGRSCTFVFDPATLTLTKGSVPGFVLRKEREQLVVHAEAAEAGREAGEPAPQ